MLEDDEFKSFLKALGIRIRLLRKEKRVNMREIMIQGFYDTQWRKYESGGGLNLSTLMKISLALKVNLRDLLDGLGQWPDFSVAEIQAQHSILPDSDLKPKPKPDAAKPHRARSTVKNTIGKTPAKKARKATSQKKATSRSPGRSKT